MQKIEYDLPIFEDTDKADLNEYSIKMATALKEQIDKFGNPLIFRGAVQTLAELQALINVQSGYIYRVDDENKNYIYNGTDWVVYSDNVDLSKYQEEVNTQINEVNTQLTNIEQEGIIVSPTEPTTNRRKVWMQNIEDKQKIYVLNDNNVYEEFMKKENTETITNENGTAIKFPSGIMICLQKYTKTINRWVEWGNIFTGIATEGIVPPNFPVSFTEIPTVIGWITTNTENTSVDSKNRAGAVQIARATKGTEADSYIINILSIGRWK